MNGSNPNCGLYSVYVGNLEKSVTVVREQPVKMNNLYPPPAVPSANHHTTS